MADLVEMTEEEIVLFSKKHQAKIGVKSGRLTTTGVAGKDHNGRIYVDAICECGNCNIYDYYSIKTCHTQSCGCLQKERTSQAKFINLVGKTFGYYYVESLYGKDKNNNILYNCICICGNRRIVNGSNLVRGNSKSCGCYSRQRLHDRIVDLTGRRYGMLVVICFYGYCEDGKTIRWLCRCDCGKECIVRGTNLKCGHTNSCGCIISVGENTIQKCLDDMGIDYIKQKRFDDCRDKNTLPFDFYIPSFDTVVEYDGIYHYDIRRNNDEDFQILQRHDQIKNKYCEEHNITLLRIPYWDRHNIPQILAKQFCKDAKEPDSLSVDLSA